MVSLVELAKAPRVHSIFAPSSANQWAVCAGSLLANILNPRRSGPEAAEGTVAHWVAHRWLKADGVRPDHLVGRKRMVDGYVIEITAEMLDHIYEYVVRCMESEGGEHFNETQIDISRVTPIPNQHGTGDYAKARPGVLHILDLKFGRRRVFAMSNKQLMLYALGWFYKLDHIYHFQEIVIEIVQPRLSHYDTWTISRNDLIEFAGYIRERARMAWKLDAPRTPGDDQCEYCNQNGACAAQAMWLESLTSNDPILLDIDYEYSDMIGALERYYEHGTPEPVMPDELLLSADEMAALLPYRDMVEGFFAGMQKRALEIELKAPNTIDGYKAVAKIKRRVWDATPTQVLKRMDEFDFSALDLMTASLLSPSQVETLVKKSPMPKETKALAIAAVLGLIDRPKGDPELVPLTDKRAPYTEDVDVDDVFDPASDL